MKKWALRTNVEAFRFSRLQFRLFNYGFLMRNLGLMTKKIDIFVSVPLNAPNMNLNSSLINEKITWLVGFISGIIFIEVFMFCKFFNFSIFCAFLFFFFPSISLSA